MQISIAVLLRTLFPGHTSDMSRQRVIVFTVFRYSRSLLRIKTDFSSESCLRAHNNNFSEMGSRNHHLNMFSLLRMRASATVCHDSADW